MNSLRLLILFLCLIYTSISASQQEKRLIAVKQGSIAADNTSGSRAPAGQMCAQGAYVIGFDTKGNIICNEVCGNGVLNPSESCDDGNTEIGDGCSATCQLEKIVIKVTDKEVPAKPILVKPVPAQPIPTQPHRAQAVNVPSVIVLTISDVEPPSVIFGTHEVKISVTGTGFHEQSVIIFDGSTYKTSVNPAGTKLDATLPTRDLSIGPYAVTVSNGPGMAATQKKALEIY